ncbi:MAG: FAD:protein FMN transferase [Ignavibacteria bacterium]|nr:FAD:protein FMN transferase [Ignavibacteria bacterium]
MNTFVTVNIYDTGTNFENASTWIDSAFAEIKRIEEMATHYSNTSEIGRINYHAGVDSVAVSEELVSLLEESLKFAEESGGAFNVAVGPIVQAWDFLAEQPRVPERERIDKLLPLIDYRLISMNGNKVYLQKKGMSLDLGGIAKGYAVDRAVDVLKAGGFKRFIVDLGGNLGVFWEGTRLIDSAAARILVRHPRKEGEFFGSFKMGSGGVATSGDYQQYFMAEGVRYHHIIDPTIGYPARGVVSVTAMAPDGITADAFSTLVFVLGRDRGMEVIKNTPGIEGMIIYEDDGMLNVDLSPGLQELFMRNYSHD